MVSENAYFKLGRIGGTSDDLDSVDGDDLNENNLGLVHENGVTLQYTLSETSAATADGYFIIEPTTNAGDKRWLLLANSPCGSTKQNLLTNSGFSVWSKSEGLYNTGSAVVDDDCADDNTSDWSVTGCTLGFDTDHYEINYVSGTYQYVYIEKDISEGSLYQVKANVKEGTAASHSLLITAGSASFIPDAGASDTITLQSYWTEVSFLVTALEDTNTFTFRTNLASGNIEIKDITIYEVNPGIEGSNSYSADEWYKDSTLDVYRETIEVKDGSLYSVKMSPSASNDYMYWPRDTNTIRNYGKFVGKIITFGCWVKTSTASHLRLFVTQTSGSSYSSYHTGGGDFEWLEVSVNISSTTVTFSAGFTLAQSSGVAYACQPMLAFGNHIGEGNYQPIPQEIIKLFISVESIELDNLVSKSSVTTSNLNIQTDTEGKIGYNVKSFGLSSIVNDSGSSTGNCWLKVGSYLLSHADYVNDVSGIADDVEKISSGNSYCFTGSLGFFQYRIEASGSGTFDINNFDYFAVTLN